RRRGRRASSSGCRVASRPCSTICLIPSSLPAGASFTMPSPPHCRPPCSPKALLQFSAALKAHRTLPARLVELVRLRIAFHNQCSSCMAIRYPDAIEDGLTEDLVCSLETPMEADDLNDAERLAIRYGELFATNHLAIDD